MSLVVALMVATFIVVLAGCSGSGGGSTTDASSTSSGSVAISSSPASSATPSGSPTGSPSASASPFYPTPNPRPSVAPRPTANPSDCSLPPAPSKVAITNSGGGVPQSPVVGQNQQLFVFSDGNDITAQLYWRSTNPAVLNVDAQSGLVYGMAAGQATITATSLSGVSGSITLTVAAASPTPTPSSATIPVEIVNDADPSKDDSDVTFMNQPLTSGVKSGTWLSPYTGVVRQIYTFNVTAAQVSSFSGRLPVQLPNGRQAFVEGALPSGDWDLTYINNFSIPLKMDVYNGADGSVATRTVYPSTPTFLDRVSKLSASMGQVIFGTSGANYDWHTDPTLSQFQMVKSPQMIGSQSNGNPSPWPSFVNYLAAVAALPVRGDGSQFYIAYDQVYSPYNGYKFKGTCQSDGKGGYLVSMTPLAGTLSPMTITLTAANDFLDFLMYQAPCVPGAFQVNGQPGDCATVYESAYDSFISSMNFGYLGGKYPDTVVTEQSGNPVSAWYAHPPTSIPGPLARTTNDGFYNPWAALIYNASDNYGYVYGDRKGRLNPQVWVNTQTRKVRITLLQDLRLDMPEVSVTGATTSSVTLSWPAVTGACGYLVGWSPPMSRPGSAFVTSPGYTISNLRPGATYTVVVRAVGPPVHGSTQVSFVRSHGLPFAASTSATPTPTPAPSVAPPTMTFPTTPPVGSATVNFQVVLGWQTAAPPPAKWFMSGLSAVPGANGLITTNMPVSGVAGPPGVPVENDYTFSYTDYQGNNRIETFILLLEQVKGGGYTITGINNSNYTPGQSNQVPASSIMANSETSQNPLASLSANSPGAWPFSATNTLILTIQYDPVPAKGFMDVKFPSPMPIPPK